MRGSRVYSAVSGMAEIGQKNDSESSDADILEVSLHNLRGCLRKNLQVNMGLKNRFLSYSTILKIYPWEQLK